MKPDKAKAEEHGAEPAETDLARVPVGRLRHVAKQLKEAFDLVEADPEEPKIADSKADVETWLVWLGKQIDNPALIDVLEMNGIKNRGNKATKLQTLMLYTVNNIE